jgi:hypothetical protein
MTEFSPPQGGFPIGVASIPLAAPTSVEYTLLPDELAESFVYQSAHNPAVRQANQRNLFRGYLTILILMVAPVLIAAMWDPRPQEAQAPPLFAVAVTVGFWCLVVGVSYVSRRSKRPAHMNSTRKMYLGMANHPSYAPLLGPYRLQVTPDGVMQAGCDREVRVRWAGVTALIAGPTVTYFDLGASGQIVVPRRAFQDDESYWALVRAAHDYKASAAAEGPSAR